MRSNPRMHDDPRRDAGVDGVGREVVDELDVDVGETGHLRHGVPRVGDRHQALATRGLDQLTERDQVVPGVLDDQRPHPLAHERRAGEIVREMMPDVRLTIGSQLYPQVREYTRTSTAM